MTRPSKSSTGSGDTAGLPAESGASPDGLAGAQEAIRAAIAASEPGFSGGEILCIGNYLYESCLKPV